MCLICKTGKGSYATGSNKPSTSSSTGTMKKPEETSFSMTSWATRVIFFNNFNSNYNEKCRRCLDNKSWNCNCRYSTSSSKDMAFQKSTSFSYAPGYKYKNY
ncbi:ORF-117 peptide [Chrysodeixis chalcites nucleopolyhedrovirus]|uniref:ORF-117 peptide n=1 Tax=Chrysodeixis chalcites nucleopolyhedrovirus TaxID=320432 RepID=Q4KSW3_9ABAC|nr:ORF-117 peptide [Chrysodeixis chalcites nucleopolyhedrovirus]AGC36331.1 hypothetical protein TF1A_00117 [Chrysodeixis chalcites SNPV TF1-A]AAY84048.1 ORF-117 peptide [Chrysodeixis chalcites nucleopolyhedrovirus]AGE61376.1 hypothetical protein [Chrysodeixis chalcites nucleopolyhedrovirus]AGE61523.1 hypothetical protein [Chrysodeixis chalcites nucleopolyhedrovirus]AGE61677.1 hypothetical protein [Chrysodeixis chalcites nucleopolyhedrovirus]